MTERAARPLDEPHASRLSPDDRWRAQILEAHREALRSGADGYADPATGNLVFSAGFLVARGECCDTGCRHCPYVA